MRFTPGGMVRIRTLLTLALMALGGAGGCDRGGSAGAQQAAAPGATPDSLRIAGVPTAVAPVFLLARQPGGVRAALDSIGTFTARDGELRKQGHQIAHALGRFAVGERGDLSVLDECTPAFQSGCIHGALEGFFLRGGTADRASVGQICPQRAEPGQPGYELLECWHGLGHGLMVHFGGDVAQVLPLCDELQLPTARRECQDGAFMERTIRAVGQAGSATGEASNGHHGAHGGAEAAPMSEARLQQLCSGVDARYQPSCWLYQPGALVQVHGVDPEAVLRACDGAPAGAVADCYRGFGKLYLAARGENARAMIRACGQGDRAHATACLLGGVEYFTDLEWTIEPGVAFCRQVPADAKAACYGMVGARLALVHPAAEQAAAACRQVERDGVGACLAGAQRAERW